MDLVDLGLRLVEHGILNDSSIIVEVGRLEQRTSIPHRRSRRQSDQLHHGQIIHRSQMISRSHRLEVGSIVVEQRKDLVDPQEILHGEGQSNREPVVGQANHWTVVLRRVLIIGIWGDVSVLRGILEVHGDESDLVFDELSSFGSISDDDFGC